LSRVEVSVKRLMKMIAVAIYYTCVSWLPDAPLRSGAPFRWIRRSLCKFIFLKCGKGVVIRKGAYFGTGRDIEIGDNSEIGYNAFLTSDVKIGKEVLMGHNVTILTTSHRYEDPDVLIHHQGMERSPVHIGDDVWIGCNCVILMGVTIGSHAVVGAGSVVTKDVPPLALVAGVPARFIRWRGSRFEQEHTSTVAG
jgi:maltose O-acetyltransferase